MESGNFPVIILAGGLGTRLRGVIDDIPKCMAPVNGKPFLHYIFHYLAKQQIKQVVLSVGYKYEAIEQYFKHEHYGIAIQYSIEREPLGTGGGIKKAFDKVSDFAFVLNGDTFFEIELNALKDFYFETSSDIALALKPMLNFERYGSVQLTENRIVRFEEKKLMSEGLINGGVYFFHKNILRTVKAEKFSFEKDVLEKLVGEKKIGGKVFDNYFIDIGIPADYHLVQKDFQNR